ncbi:MAG TPA: hypothetical protein VMV78_12625 [Thiobacillus sp.]|nr:hypothetical protein [Thiobacillus sp.]
MAKPNYSFAKRQRDLAKKQKKEEKLRRKAGAGESQPQDDQPQDDQLQGGEPLPTGNEEPAT